MNNQKKLRRYAVKVRYPEGRHVIDHCFDLMRRGNTVKNATEALKIFEEGMRRDYEITTGTGRGPHTTNPKGD